jgi:hypothetical protein
MANTSTLQPRPANLTPHFRNLLREENPLWPTPDLYRWSWSDLGPVYNGLLIDLKKVDSCHPGGSAIIRMLHDIKSGVWQLTRHPAPKFIP